MRIEWESSGERRAKYGVFSFGGFIIFGDHFYIQFYIVAGNHKANPEQASARVNLPRIFGYNYLYAHLSRS